MLAMNEGAQRSIVLGTESYEVIRDAMNTREITDVDFGRVSEVIPTFMSTEELEDFRAQYEVELLERNPDWSGSLKRHNSRLIFTIGQACVGSYDSVTAKSAERTLWRQKSALSWVFALMLKKDIRRYHQV